MAPASISRMDVFRIIPTGVGKRHHRDQLRGVDTDHPHGRGEKRADADGLGVPAGSSPRAWGKVSVRRGGYDEMRIIPTGVGKRVAGQCFFHRHADHPHGRGEKSPGTRQAPCHAGSSPRAWGKGYYYITTNTEARIIPTGVGKRRTHAFNSVVRSDHPHGRGEKAL